MNATPTLSKIERIRWDHNVNTLLPSYPSQLWHEAFEHAARRTEAGAYKGEFWHNRVIVLAESLLDEIGVEWEIRAGQRYIAGRRIWWSNNGRWEQD